MSPPQEKQKWWTQMPVAPLNYYPRDGLVRDTDVCANCGHVRYYHRRARLTGEVKCFVEHGGIRECDCYAANESQYPTFHWAGIPGSEWQRIQDSHTDGGTQKLINQPSKPGRPIAQ